MTPKERAAMQQALEALEVYEIKLNSRLCNEAITALREVLAEQAEQDLDTCPGCGGVADNGHDREFPPNPYYCTKCTEQAEQEPVAWGCRFQDGSIHDCICPEYHAECEGDYNIPLYAAPVRTKDLTDDEIVKVFNDVVGAYGHVAGLYKIDFARSVIAADREKNNANNNS